MKCPMPVSILVVEDEAITLDYLVVTLARKYPDSTIHGALNGRTGLELFKTHLHDIVITDINMPEMGGVEMADAIHAIEPDTRFIVLTGDTGKLPPGSIVENGLRIHHYLDKPVDFLELFSAIDECAGAIGRMDGTDGTESG